jgi:hypothetical protein
MASSRHEVREGGGFRRGGEKRLGEARTTKWRMEMVVVVDRLCRRT